MGFSIIFHLQIYVGLTPRMKNLVESMQLAFDTSEADVPAQEVSEQNDEEIVPVQGKMSRSEFLLVNIPQNSILRCLLNVAANR